MSTTMPTERDYCSWVPYVLLHAVAAGKVTDHVLTVLQTNVTWSSEDVNMNMRFLGSGSFGNVWEVVSLKLALNKV